MNTTEMLLKEKNIGERNPLASLQKETIKLEVEKEELRLILKSLVEQGQADLFEKLNQKLKKNKIYLNINEPAMSYKDFVSLEMVLENFQLKAKNADLFEDVIPIEESELSLFRTIMERHKKTPMISEKAKSEAIIYPVLIEVLARSRQEFVIFSGKTFRVDSSKGLTGICDFLLSAAGSAKQVIYAPVFAAVEAKKEGVEDHLGQCAAEMVAARIFNKEKKRNIDTIYGLVTSGTNWIFMKLEGDTIYVDSVQYYEIQLNKIIAILQHIVESCIAE
ncbi:MAG: hypothetical protein AB8B69_15645 [Chitinophagales bacterium]